MNGSRRGVKRTFPTDCCCMIYQPLSDKTHLSPSNSYNTVAPSFISLPIGLRRHTGLLPPISLIRIAIARVNRIHSRGTATQITLFSASLLLRSLFRSQKKMPSVRNPILPGFLPDASIVRVGDSFYIAISTFQWFSGVQIYHSKDLASWELVAHPLDRKSLLDM